jgi:hypothetical protein
MHCVEPVVFLNVEAGQMVQNAGVPVYPRLQVQLFMLLLPSPEYAFDVQSRQSDDEFADSFVEYFPARHWVQTLEANLVEYVPAIHALQYSPSHRGVSLAYPGMHWQDVLL